MKASVLFSALDDYKIHSILDYVDFEISDLCVDSRKCKTGDLFIRLHGRNFDSPKYAEEAVRDGAVAVVTDEILDVEVPQILVKDCRTSTSLLACLFYGNPSEKLKIIGITGTNGKTTTSYMLANIIKSAGKKTGIIGTLGIFYDKKEIAPELTTPDPVYLQRTLADMHDHGVEYVVMEVSAHALYYEKVAGIEFVGTIFTNFTQDHLDFFFSMEEYKQAKLKLFASEKCSLAFVNLDDETGREILKLRSEAVRAGNPKTRTYALKTPSDSFAVITRGDLKRVDFMLNLDDELGCVSLRMTGEHNVYNALGAAACAYELGFSMEEIQNGLNDLNGVKGRLEWIATYNGAEIFIDFAHTPDGLKKSLQSLRNDCEGRLICVFGCGGDRDKTKRPSMGRISGEYADLTVLTSDNPRYEDPCDIIRDIEKGLNPQATNYVCVPDRERAIRYVMKNLVKGDVLLIAGKGGEDYQERMGIKYSYKDEDLVVKIIKKE